MREIQWSNKIKEACRMLREQGGGLVLLNDLVPDESDRLVNLGVPRFSGSGVCGKKPIGRWLWEIRKDRAVQRALSGDNHPLLLWVHYDEETDTTYAGLSNAVDPDTADRWARMNDELEVAVG